MYQRAEKLVEDLRMGAQKYKDSIKESLVSYFSSSMNAVPEEMSDKNPPSIKQSIIHSMEFHEETL